MSNFSAKVNLISAIIDTQTSWHIVIDVIDEYGIYYADDVRLGDILYNLSTADVYTITEISLFNGIRLIGKVNNLNSSNMPTNNLVIGRLINGIFSYTNEVIQTLNNNNNLTEEFSTETCELSFQPKLDTIRVYLNGIRLRLNDDYTIVDKFITIIDFELEDIIVIDYERL